MTLDATRTRVLVAALIALALFAIAFFVARSGSSDAALRPVRVQPASGPAALEHAPLRAIGSVPALPRAPRKPKPRPSPRPSSPATTPPPAAVPPPAAFPPPPPPPPPPSSTCVNEFC
jgi:hypothetical protein